MDSQTIVKALLQNGAAGAAIAAAESSDFAQLAVCINAALGSSGYLKFTLLVDVSYRLRHR